MFVRRVEAKARFAGHGVRSSLEFVSYNSENNFKYSIFAHKGKIHTSFGTVKGLCLFVCTLFAS